jgi:tetratricopeptide (TPR) repeat protein
LTRAHRSGRFGTVARVLLLLLVAGCGALGQTDNASPLERADRGDYAGAARALEDLVEDGIDVSPPAVEALYFSWIRQGEYEHALERFEELTEANVDSGPLRLAAARANTVTGNYERALEHVEQILTSADVGVPAMYEKAVLLATTGRLDESNDIYTELIDRFLDGIITAPNQLIYVARSMWAMDYIEDAHDVFRFIVEQNPRDKASLVAWGDMLAAKYQNPDSLSSYEDALAIDPNMPEANLGIAALLAQENLERSELALEAAFDVNPNYPEAHLLLARQRIISEQYDDADQETERALEVNPRLAPALALRATTSFLRGDAVQFESYVQQVLAANPSYGEMYRILAEQSVMVRLYEQAVEFAREAIRLNPRDWDAYSLLGINLLRIGEEEAGKAALEEAYENDRYNIWTVNTLTLLDSFEDFDRLETSHFKIMLHKEERAALAPYVTALLEEAYETLSSKYRFEPEWPITFEMFPSHDDFAVRTLGLPGLGALGVSFGKVVVMDSPSARPPGEFNWGGTLWHEFAHVITLQITDHKVPRWFSEGLSVFEEKRARPGWGEDLQPDFLAAIRDDQFLPIGDLNKGFVRPSFPGQIQLSYYQASLVCDYIEEMFGFEAILDMLALYKDNRGTDEVFENALGVSLSQFDREFNSWLDMKTTLIDVEAFRTRTQAGYEALSEGDLPTAIEELSVAVNIFPEYSGEQNPYLGLAEAYEMDGNPTAAIETLERLTAYSEYGYQSLLDLARLKVDTGDTEGAAEALGLSMYISPIELEGHREYGQVLLENDNFLEAAREYEVLLALNTPDLATTYYQLASAQYGAGLLPEARRNILESLKIAPSFEEAQELLLQIVRSD